MDTTGPILEVMPSWLWKAVLMQIRYDRLNGASPSEDSIRGILAEMRAEITAVIDHPLGRG